MKRQHPLLRSTLVAMLVGLALSGPALANSADSHDEFRAAIQAAESEAFAEADANGDGKLTAAEFATFNQLIHQKLEALRFNRLDTNGDGAITKAELEAGHPMGHHGPGF